MECQYRKTIPRGKTRGKVMRKDIKFYLVLIASVAILLMTTFYQISLLDIQNSQNEFLIIIMAAMITGIVCLLSICFYKEKDLSVEKACKVLLPIIFILFFICMPMFKNHDEDHHWIRIYDITQGNLLTSTEHGHIFAENSSNYPATELPRAVLDVVDMQYSQSHGIRDLLEVEINKDDKIYVAMPTTAIYAPIQYMPQAIGAYLSDLITDKPIIIAYAARFVNMLFCYTVLYFAIKLMPFEKKIMLATIAIPIAVEGFTSLSPDGMTISMSLLLIAYVLNLVFNKQITKITWKHKITLAFISIVVALCKIVYLPLVGLVLLLPKEKFKSNKEQIITISVIILIAVVINLRMACNF